MQKLSPRNLGGMTSFGGDTSKQSTKAFSTKILFSAHSRRFSPSKVSCYTVVALTRNLFTQLMCCVLGRGWRSMRVSFAVTYCHIHSFKEQFMLGGRKVDIGGRCQTTSMYLRVSYWSSRESQSCVNVCRLA